MVNNYSWSISRERDVISHGTAHLSKNWTKDKQKEYNHWYYENKIKPQYYGTSPSSNLKDGETQTWARNLINGEHDKEYYEDYNEIANEYEQDLKDGIKTISYVGGGTYDVAERAKEFRDLANAFKHHYENHTLKGISEQVINKGKDVISKYMK